MEPSTHPSRQEEPPYQAAHDQAVAQGQDYYFDPQTGLLVFTEQYLLKKGVCCRSGCRHCPWGFKK